MSITKLNWSQGFFRLWLSASILWWLAITASIVVDQSRQARVEFLRSQGVECARESAVPLFASPGGCRSLAGDSAPAALALGDLLDLTADRLRTGAPWQRWAQLAWLPLGAFVAGILARSWARWIRRGLAPGVDAGPAQEKTIDDGRHTGAAIPTVGIEAAGHGGETDGTGKRGPGLRADLVRATQMLNELDDELVELDFRLVGSSKERAHELRREIPGFGRRLIALVHALDKQGLAPDNLRLFGGAEGVRRDSASGRTGARPGSSRDAGNGGKGVHCASS
jgi:hypothetical protein